MSKAKARVFVPLTKVDEEQRLVYGRITQEVLDKSGEAMDYVTSKPLFEKWSNEIHTNSGGLSKGNVRVMHGLTAAGKLTELDFNDTDQGIDVCAKIVDDAEWNKCLEGVYTGFSVGGAYEKRWTETLTDGTKLKKFTARPNEVSLVDNPCVPSATFTMLKADGSEQSIDFQVENDDDQWPAFSKAEVDALEGDEKVIVGDAPTTTGVKELTPEEQAAAKAAAEPKTAAESAIVGKATATFIPSNMDVAAKATELAKAAGDTKPWVEYIDDARTVLVKAHNEAEGIVDEPTAKATTEAKTGDDLAETAVAATGESSIEKTDVAPRDALLQKWVTTDGQLFEKKAEAEAHQATLPVVELTEVEKLAKRMKEALAKGEAGEDLNVVVITEVDDDMDRLAKAMEAIEAGVVDGKPVMQKGMYTVSKFARMIADMASLTSSIKVEGVVEGDDGNDANVSSLMKENLSAFAESFKTYADQQITEILAGIDTDTLSPCYDYYYACAKADSTDQLAKDVCSIIDERKVDREEKIEGLTKAFTVDPTGDFVSLEKYTKLEGDVADFKKIAEEAVAQVEVLAKSVQQIKDTPMPRAPRGTPVGKEGDTFFGKSVTNEEDRIGVLQEMLKTHTPDQLATMMIKAAHATGGQQLTLRS